MVLLFGGIFEIGFVICECYLYNLVVCIVLVCLFDDLWWEDVVVVMK